MRIAFLITAILMLASCYGQQPQPEGYHLAKTVPIGGSGGWDYVKVDAKARRVYVTHNTQMEVLDADSGQPVGVMGSLRGAHGIALAQDLRRGFISNGLSNTVTIFDLNTLKAIREVKTEKKPDALVYDDLTERLLAFNGDSNSATVINGKTGKKIGTIALNGKPEFAVADDKGHVFVNLEDTNEILMLDVAKLKVLNHWKTGPGESPSSLAMDRINHRLFIGCRNKLLVVMDSDDGHVITSLPIGDHVDATAYDPETHQVISSTGDGALTVIQQDDADHYHIAQTVATRQGSRTFGLDAKTHKLFVPAADFGPAPIPIKDNPQIRPQILPGTFSVMMYER